MKTINNKKFQNQQLIFIVVILFSTISSSFTSVANDLYSVSPFIDLSKNGLTDSSWLPPMSIENKSEILLTDTLGKVYRTTNTTIQKSPIIDFSTFLTSTEAISFSAITLHPNFHQADLVGAGIVYTAHNEKHDPSSNNTRLKDGDRNNEFLFDAVIIEWQLNNTDSENVDMMSKRELIRIGANAPNKATHLSFNPYLKAWSDDFGLLHIAFAEAPELSEAPLYSGVILRINPEKFGLKNYTIPPSNSFIKSSKIKDEIIILGAQNIQQFTWSKHSQNNLVVTHTYNNKALISLISTGTNLLLSPEIDPILESTDELPVFSNEYYQGRKYIELWNKLVFITKNESTWQLKASHVLSTNENSNSPSNSLSIDMSSFPSSNELSLFITKQEDIFIWDITEEAIYKVVESPLNTNTSPVTPKVSSDQQSPFQLIYFFILIALCILGVFFVKSKYKQLFSQNKTLLRSNFAKIKFHEKSRELLLFKRHETDIDTVISVPDICASEIFLNDESLNIVTTYNNSAYNEAIETEMRQNFDQEHRDKMIDDKVRKINLKITTIKGDEFLICVYLRAGNQRLTKEKYHDVIEQLVDWQWYLSSQINATETPKRAHKPLIKRNDITIKPKKFTPKMSNKVTTPIIPQGTVGKSTDNTSYNHNEKNTSKVDTKLVDALNKLVSLKEQGYLTEEEFNAAKQNLLENITNNI